MRREKPVLDLRNYFNGIVDGYGIFTDRAGKVVKRFTVVIHCSWSGDDGVLDEDFLYSDGTRQKRIWRLQRNCRMAASPAGPTTSSARRRASSAAMPCTGPTRWRCRSTAGSSTCSSTTGCT